MVYMTERCKAVIHMLMTADTWLTLPQLEEALGVSRRSIYYDLCRVNEWLEEHGIPELEVVRGKGIFITPRLREQIEQVAEQTETADCYIFSPMERIHVIICTIILSDGPVYIDRLTDFCQVSRNTIFNDLRVVVNQLQDYDLSLRYESKNGYFIEGDCMKLRAVFLLHLHELETLAKEGRLPFIGKDVLERNLARLKQVESGLNTKYVEGTLLSLAALLPVMERGNSQLYFPNLKREELERTREWLLIGQQFQELESREQVYLCLHFLGSRVAVADTDIFEESSNQSTYELTKALVAEFEKHACVLFGNREELERQLFVHINSSLYRYQYGIQIGESMCNDIIREYPELFDITKSVSHYLEQQVGLPIPDSEVAYLALHFGAHLSIARRDDSRLRILIVCVNGISTGNMLKRELIKLLPQAEIVGVSARATVQNAQDICDLVITTVKMKCIVPTILVHPILTRYDRECILNHPRVKTARGAVDEKKLFAVLEPFIAREKREAARRALQEYLGGDDGGHPAAAATDSLTRALTMETLTVVTDTCRWTESIWNTGRTLVERGNIQEAYLRRIISQIRYYGPYMFITPRVILAHARPEDGVHTMGVAMAVYKKGVRFSDFHTANIVIVLAAEDQEKHLRILRDISAVFSIQARIDDILALDTARQVREYLMGVLEHDNG